MTFLELAEKVLTEAKRPLTNKEIWNWAVEKGYDQQLKNRNGKTPERTLSSRLLPDASDNPNSLFTEILTNPRQFYLKSQTNHVERLETDVSNEQIIGKNKKPDFYEIDLHIHLAYYASWSEDLFCCVKTIDHTKSSKDQAGKWVHPDMVGCRFYFNEREPHARDFGFAIGHIPIHLISFELKKKLSSSDLVDFFFQAVADSSWANEGYLVAAEVDEDPMFQNELERLSKAFGIGVIQLDIKNPDDSKTIYPAKHRETLDWEMIHKLAVMNPDFREFLSRITIDINSKTIHKEKYQQFQKIEELAKSINP